MNNLILINLALLFISFYFGYIGKPARYIFLTLIISGLISIIYNSPLYILLGILTFIPFIGIFASMFLLGGFILSIILHYIAWWVGHKIGGEK